jgi:fructose-bisphosphate aldolase class I
VTETTLKRVYDQWHRHNVLLEGTLLKPNMVVSGKDCAQQAGVEQVAEMTLRCLTRCVPAAVPGIVFLSGGQSAEDATAHLNAINAMGPHPWEVSFSYGRALQAPAMEAWAGKPANVPKAQEAYFHRAKLNGAARDGKYTSAMEQAA